MEELTRYILKFGSIGKQEMELIWSKSSTLSIAKGDYFSEAGKIPKQVGFIIEGVIRGYYCNDEGAEITRCFITEESLVCDYVNFEANTVSVEYLHAVTDCRLVVFSRTDWEELSKTVAGWDNVKNKMVHLCMYEKSRKGPVVSQDATTRYLQFLQNYPTVINRVPLSHIASYLGVTQQSLSRIRKNIR